MLLYRAIDSEYIRKVSDIRYEIENYNDKAKGKYKVENRSYGRIRRHLIIGLKEYII